MTTIFVTDEGGVREFGCVIDGQNVLNDVMGGCGVQPHHTCDFQCTASEADWWERWAELEERINDALDGADALTLERHSMLVDEFGYDLGLLHEKEVELLGIDD